MGFLDGVWRIETVLPFDAEVFCCNSDIYGSLITSDELVRSWYHVVDGTWDKCFPQVPSDANWRATSLVGTGMNSTKLHNGIKTLIPISSVSSVRRICIYREYLTSSFGLIKCILRQVCEVIWTTLLPVASNKLRSDDATRWSSSPIWGGDSLRVDFHTDQIPYLLNLW